MSFPQQHGGGRTSESDPPIASSWPPNFDQIIRDPVSNRASSYSKMKPLSRYEESGVPNRFADHGYATSFGFSSQGSQGTLPYSSIPVIAGSPPTYHAPPATPATVPQSTTNNTKWMIAAFLGGCAAAGLGYYLLVHRPHQRHVQRLQELAIQKAKERQEHDDEWDGGEEPHGIVPPSPVTQHGGWVDIQSNSTPTSAQKQFMRPTSSSDADGDWHKVDSGSPVGRTGRACTPSADDKTKTFPAAEDGSAVVLHMNE